MKTIKNKTLEYYQVLANFCMYVGPVFGILTLLCGLGYNHFNKKIKDLKEQTVEANTSSDKRLAIDFDVKLVLPYQIFFGNQPYSGQLGLMCYDMTIVNTSASTLTVKEVKLEYKLDGKHFSEDALILPTGIVYSDDKVKSYPSLMTTGFFDNTGKTATMYLLDWYNIREKILEKKLLQSGETLHGSAFFLLHTKQTEVLSRIDEPVISVSDYFGSTTKTPIEKASFTNSSNINIIHISKFQHISPPPKY